MFTVTEGQLKGVIAPITPFYGSPSEWLNLEAGELTTFSDIYRTQPGVRSVVDFVADHCARMPLKLYQQEDGTPGSEGERMHLRKHPMQKLMNVPNGHKRMGRANFWRSAWLDFLIYDRVCLVKIKDLESGDPVALVRVPPVWFTPFGQNYWWPEEIRIIGNRGFVNFDIESCVYIHGYDPVDPRVGVSPMTTLKSILEEEAAGTAWRRRFWDQGAQPTMVVSRPVEADDWDDDARDRFIESLRASAKRGQPLLLEDGMTTNSANNFNPKSTEYLGTKKFTRDEVLRVYNMPVGLFEQGTASNIGQYRSMLYSEALAPLMGRWVDELETQLLTEWSDDPYDAGMFLEPAINERLTGDPASTVKMLFDAIGRPFMLPSEGRAYMNLPKLPDAQKATELTIPAGVTFPGVPVTRETLTGQAPGAGPKETEAITGTGKPGQGRPPTGNVDAATADSRSQSQNQKPTAEGGAAPAKTRDKARQSARDKRIKAQFVKEVTGTLQKFAERQRSAVMSAQGAKTVPFNKKRWDKELAADLYKERRRVAEYYAGATADELASEGFDPDEIENYLQDGADAEAKNINEQTFERVQDADDLGKVFDDLFGRMARAATDTVSHMAAFGAIAAGEQAGQAVIKIWNVLSGNPRPSHAALDGEERNLDEPFGNGLMYPHDPSGSVDEVAGCQCDLSVRPSSDSNVAGE